jgi:hypothetical protein
VSGLLWCWVIRLYSWNKFIYSSCKILVEFRVTFQYMCKMPGYRSGVDLLVKSWSFHFLRGDFKYFLKSCEELTWLLLFSWQFLSLLLKDRTVLYYEGATKVVEILNFSPSNLKIFSSTPPFKAYLIGIHVLHPQTIMYY